MVRRGGVRSEARALFGATVVQLKHDRVSVVLRVVQHAFTSFTGTARNAPTDLSISFLPFADRSVSSKR